MKKRSQNRWFFVSGTSVRASVLSAAWVDVVVGKELKCPVIVSLPKTCGLAVARNRFRRMSRSYFTDLLSQNNLDNKCDSTRKVIWIRVDRRHRLQKRIVLTEWKPLFEKLYARLLQANPSP